MKVLIFLGWKPVLTETFILNEFDLLSKSGINFRVYYSYKYGGNIENPDLKKYKDIYSYIPQIPKNTIKKILSIIHCQLQAITFQPVKYLKILFWVLFHYQRILLRSFLRLAPFLREISIYSPDLIYCHYTYENVIFAFLSKMYLGKNEYFTITHQQNIYEPLLSNLSSYFSPNKILVKSEYVKKLWKIKYPALSQNRILVLPWGIDTKYFSPVRSEKKKNLFTILSICRLVEQKGLITLLRTCKILAQKYEFRCLIYGEGPERKKLLDYINANNLTKHIKINGFIHHSERFKRTVSKADLFVLPCILDKSGEGDVIPNILLEVMAMGLPTITTKVSGMKEYIKQGENGYIIDNSQEKILARLIEKIMDSSPKERFRIGNEARKMVCQYWDKTTLGIEFYKYLNQLCQF